MIKRNGEVFLRGYLLKDIKIMAGILKLLVIFGVLNNPTGAGHL